MKDFNKMNKSELIAELEKHYGTAEVVTVTHSRDCAEAFWPLISKAKKEAVVVMYISGSNQIIEKELITREGLNSFDGSVFRKIFRKAIKLSSASIITGHKVFEKYSEPKKEDLELLRNLLKTSEIIGIELLDHVVMHKNGHYSYHGNGKI